MKMFEITATMSVQLNATIGVPDHWSEDDVHDAILNGKIDGGDMSRDEKSWDWTWGDVDLATDANAKADVILEDEVIS